MDEPEVGEAVHLVLPPHGVEIEVVVKPIDVHYADVRHEGVDSVLAERFAEPARRAIVGHVDAVDNFNANALQLVSARIANRSQDIVAPILQLLA